jgi:hypothetical protein
MTPEEIIKKGDSYLYSTTDLDKRMYKRLIKFLSSHTLGGKVNISNEDLAVLEDIIYNEVKDSDYQKNIGNYLGLLNALENAISEQQYEINRIKAQKIRDLWRGNDLRVKLQDKIIYDLGQGGIKDYFVKGLSQVVKDASFFNLTIDDAVEKLSKVLIDDDYTNRYIRQTANDALSQYQGAINDAVAVAYELDDILYIGNVIETSRPICSHLRDDLKGRIAKEQLIKVLNDYCPNGVPSESKITYTTVSGETHTKKKGSGMIEGTRYDNFRQLKGGYGCRHEAVPTDLSRKR